MKKIINEHKRLKIGACLGAFICILLMFFAIYFTPNWIANNLNPGGILEHITTVKINLIRIGFGTLGTIGLLISVLYIIQPHIFKKFYSNLNKLWILKPILFLFPNTTIDFEKPSNKLFILLILTDLAFIFIHVLYKMDVVINPLWSIKIDRGYAELYQYIKEFWITLLLFIMAIKRSPIKRSHIIYLTWSILFMYLLLDDSLQIHERMGCCLVDYFKLQPALNLRAEAFGELGVSMLFGSLFFLFIGCAYLFSDIVAKKISKHLFILVLSLAFCGVLVDTFHRAIPFGKSIWVFIEDGGEMLIMSIILAYVFNLKVTSKESTIVYENI